MQSQSFYAFNAMTLVNPDAVDKALHYAFMTLNWASAVALFAAVLLLQSSVLQKLFRVTPAGLNRKLPVITAIFFLSMLQQIAATRSLMVDTQDEVRRGIGAPTPLGLSGVIDAIDAELSSNTSELIEIHHLALDMKNAWDEVNAKLLRHVGSRPIKYELLILTEPPQLIDPKTGQLIDPETAKDKDKGLVNGVPKEVVGWGSDGKKKVEEDIVPALKGLSDKPGSRFEWEIKQYAETPFVHGFRTQTASLGSHYFMTFCRWDESKAANNKYLKWFWGPSSYFRLQAPDPTREKQNYDFSLIFDGFFTHLWQTNKTYSSGKSR